MTLFPYRGYEKGIAGSNNAIKVTFFLAGLVLGALGISRCRADSFASVPE